MHKKEKQDHSSRSRDHIIIISYHYNNIITAYYKGQPPAPNEVIRIENHSQFTPSTASITLTWSNSSEPSNYTITVMPPSITSEESLEFPSTTASRVILTVLYNVDYSINITAHNCAGSNSTVLQLRAGKLTTHNFNKQISFIFM